VSHFVREQASRTLSAPAQYHAVSLSACLRVRGYPPQRGRRRDPRKPYSGPSFRVIYRYMAVMRELRTMKADETWPRQISKSLETRKSDRSERWPKTRTDVVQLKPGVCRDVTVRSASAVWWRRAYARPAYLVRYLEVPFDLILTYIHPCLATSQVNQDISFHPGLASSLSLWLPIRNIDVVAVHGHAGGVRDADRPRSRLAFCDHVK
jgi:hypothetical protein